MKLNFKRLFDKVILQRGYDYYKKARVSNLLKIGEIITASVQGSHRYKVSINLETDSFRCNCPYEGDLCKHLAAVCYAVNNSKHIKTGENIERNLAKKSKEELVRIMREMLVQEPKLSQLLSSKEEQIKRKIKDIDSQDEYDEWAEFYDYIPDKVEEIIEEINKTANKKDLLILLLKEVNELNEKYDHHGSTEDSVFYVLERLDEETKTLSKIEAKEITLKIKQILKETYDSFTQEAKNEK